MEYRLPLAEFANNVARHPNQLWLHQPDNREWRTLTWAQADDQARRIAAGLLAQGFEKGDRIAIFAKNSAEWFIADLAIMMAGMISVPIYATAGTSMIRHVMSHSEAKAVFVGKLDNTEAAERAFEKGTQIITFPYPTLSGTDKFTDWLERYGPLLKVNTPAAGDTFTLVYTSGSTGLPKGVVLTYENIAAASGSAVTLHDKSIPNRSMSYLPLAHITERSVVEILSIYSPQEIFFVESLDTFIDDVRHARPTTFVSVPRLWTKFQAQILAQLPDEKLQKLLKVPLVGKLVSKKIRKGLGLSQSRLCASGSAPISPGILEWYDRLGISICEGWGMTETAGLSCANFPFDRKSLGTIGTAQECVEMKLSNEGEVLIRGAAVFKEYYKNSQATEDAFVDGWFRTGDRGVYENGVWKIIGRVKEQFKTAKGKYVAPVPIESLLARNADIEQVCVMGIGRKQPLAIVVMNEQIRHRSDDVRAKLQKTLQEVNSELESHERLDHIVVSEEVWGIENDMLTPTLKIKRNKLEERYGEYLTRQFSGTVVWESELEHQ
ncbi:AMP-binding protein [Parendozoicomonas sp. Alg238-R29]|uniref:AMP-binding protein n=1 Tax=Parendozoicomonas sp. Alg238-R29 TaxID=2993446 RepID=UPI00248E6F2D|nr:AMP-binding protein [Parendozoicomonas sp. Alg238-R29]